MKRGIVEGYTYEWLDDWLSYFKNRQNALMMLISEAGYGKTEIVTRMLAGTEYCFINSHVSALSLYQMVFENRNRTLVIDDIDNLLDDDNKISLLKQLTETRHTKTISWHSTTDRLDGIPRTFETTGKVLIIGNDLKVMRRKARPIVDRGICLLFMPSRSELIDRMVEISSNIPSSLGEAERQEVIDYIRDNGTNFITLRTLTKGFGFRECCEDWQDKLTEIMGMSSLGKCYEKQMICKTLMETYESDTERLNDWAKKYGFSRRSYYMYKKQVSVSVQRPKLHSIPEITVPKSVNILSYRRI